MLEQLVRYAARSGLAGPGFTPKRVKWAILYAPDGHLMGVNELSDGSGKKRNPGREFAVCPETSGMSSGGKSHFLVETLETVLLMCKKEEDRPKFEAKHDFFVKQLRDAAVVCSEMAWFANLIDDDATRAKIIAELTAQKAAPTDKITMMIEGREPPFLVDDPIWHDWWDDYRKTLDKAPASDKRGRDSPKKGDERMRCFMSGDWVEPAKTHPKVTGLTDVGASAMGASLVSFDKDALCSYGLKQSANAAMSEEAAAAYRAGLNHVVAKHSRALAGVKVAYWFDKRVRPEGDMPQWLFGADDEQQEIQALQEARKLLDAIRAGEAPPFATENHYYAVTLSGNGGRVVVRDWMTGPFEELLGNVLDWFDHFAIVHRRGDGLAPPPKFMAVLGSLVRDLKDVPAPLVGSMLNAAIKGAGIPIPRSALARAVDRAKLDVLKDSPPNHARMGLIKAYHLRKGDTQMTSHLNEDHPSTAYQCGRLMALLANVQYRAQGDVGAGVVQRYYAAASATPALVLGQLTRLSQFHLNKLDRGLAGWFERQIADIWSKIENGPPRTLSLEEQSLFAMGFYQQKASRSKAKSEEQQQVEEQ